MARITECDYKTSLISNQSIHQYVRNLTARAKEGIMNSAL